MLPNAAGILLVPVDEVRYLKAEMKYVTAFTTERDYVLDESLVQLEEEFGERFLRIHRNCLVARDAIVGVEREGGLMASLTGPCCLPVYPNACRSAVGSGRP